ncbi:hypothetical protein MHBO_001299 [Bonamia ostreae]|uniref:RBR-type E3 ubiquitin transferase n=1 Tax=Bonamia ostreae TaxID=126728 RepID=A0ABV2AIG5_9EUKA
MESDSFDDDDFEDVTGALRALDVTGNAESPFASMTLAELALFAREKTERFARKQNLSGDCAELVLKQIGFDESKYSPEMAELAAKIDAKLNSIDIDRRGKPRICKICCGDLSEAVSGVPCGHRFCGECWKQYLETAMQTSGINAAKVACPFYGCNSILLSSFLDTVLADETRARYERFCADFFVFHSEDAIDCVNPKCDLFVCRTGGDGRRHGRCKCGALFCFVCEAEDHRPATCAQVFFATEALRVGEEVRERVEFGQLLAGEHEALPQLRLADREEQGLQPHGLLQLPPRVLLGLPARLDGTQFAL